MTNSKEKLLQEALRRAAFNGCVKGVMLCKSFGILHLDEALRIAASTGDSDIATACLASGPCLDGRGNVSEKGDAAKTHVPIGTHFLIKAIKKAAKRKHRNIIDICVSYAHKLSAENALSPDDWAQIHGYEKKCDAMVSIADSVIETIDERCWKTILFGKEACEGMDLSLIHI